MRFSTSTEFLVNKVTGKAIYDYKMISRNDKILVGVSGPDSLSLLDVLKTRQSFVPIKYKLIAVHVDMNAKNAKVIEDYLKGLGVEYYIVKADLNEGKKDIKTGECFWCSWKRREEIFKLASRLKCKKIAFGHHLDDIDETFLMNVFLHGEISTMPPKLAMFKGRFKLIRPFCRIEKKHIEQYAREKHIPFMPFKCPYGKVSSRALMRRIIEDVGKRCPDVKINIFRSSSNIKRAYLP